MKQFTSHLMVYETRQDLIENAFEYIGGTSRLGRQAGSQQRVMWTAQVTQCVV